MKGFCYYAAYMSEVLTDEALEASIGVKAPAATTVEADEEEILFQAMREAELCGDWDLYSDLYKDIFGIRPR